MPQINLVPPETNWEAPNSGDGPGESWRSLLTKQNAMNAELFARLAKLESTVNPPASTQGTPL